MQHNFKVTQVLGTNNYDIVTMHILEKLLDVRRYYVLKISKRQDGLIDIPVPDRSIEVVVRKAEFLENSVKLILSMSSDDFNYINTYKHAMQGNEESPMGIELTPIASSSLPGQKEADDDINPEDEEVKTSKKK